MILMITLLKNQMHIIYAKKWEELRMTQPKSSLWISEFTEEAKAITEPEIGLKILATIDERNWPHLTLITFNKAKTLNQVVWGQFTEGLSKRNVQVNPNQGVFYMNTTMPFKFVQVKMQLEYILHEGEDCEAFSRGAMLRYMTYTNVHTCYYNKVIKASLIRPLGLIGIIRGFLTNLITKGGVRSKNPEKKLPDLSMIIFNQMTSVKVISYIDSDGYPIIIPVFGLRAPDQSRLVFPLSQFGDELKCIPVNTKLAIYGVVTNNLELTNMEVVGTFTGFIKSRSLFQYGIIEIEEVYNSMPPLNGIIYPKLEVRPKITSFPTELT